MYVSLRKRIYTCGHICSTHVLSIAHTCDKIGPRMIDMNIENPARIRFTPRLRLEPINAGHATDLWLLHQDEAVARWHGGTWSTDDARRNALRYDQAWQTDGVHKWIAYDRSSAALVGRGGLSRTRLAGKIELEIGWTVRSPLWGHGYATEIGLAGLTFGFDELHAEEIVSFTERHNSQSRAVMERLGMRYEREMTGRGLVEGLDGIHDHASFVRYVKTRERHHYA